MKEKETKFVVDGKEYKAVFNLNVMQAIQIEYETFEKWGRLTDGYVYDENNEKVPLLDKDGTPVTKRIKTEDGEVDVQVFETREVNIKALIFGIKEMINEAIDIDNEKDNKNDPFLTEKQVGRLVTAMGILEATRQLNDAVVDSTKEDNPKNE